MSKSSGHAAIETLEYEDGMLLWGGRRVSELADEAGQTPFYAYDRRRMDERVKALRSAMPDRLHIHYAIKANPMPEVVAHMARLVDGLDVASQAELEIALATECDPSDISFAGPGKRDPELSAAIEAGITINMESTGEMQRIACLGNELGSTPQVAIRINPSFELKSAGMKMGGRPSQFGIDAERVPAVLDELGNLELNFRGFHVFSGSQNLRPEAITDAMIQAVDLVIRIAEMADVRPEFVNLGGGIGIPYFPNERPIELGAIASTVHDAVERLAVSFGSIETVMELGRYLVGEAGIYVVRVVDLKESRGLQFAVCDGGMHHHLAASGNFGQVLRKNYPVVAVEKRAEATKEISVVGPLCTPLDLIGDRIQLHDISEGSLIAILQSGAYGASASPKAFLSHPDCLEVVV